ncbi:MAG: tetratricopeptide repeat protein [Planctomycetota bacterium]
MLSTERGHDPCLQIQVDLSAMLDGELDPPHVRRVMVHSDVCRSCREFLDGIRSQVQLHRHVADTSVLAASDGDAVVEANESERAAHLREQLTVNRRKLSRILYELGRCFVLMGLSPDFSREVANEPVPVPDLAMRGRSMLDEVVRSASRADVDDGGGAAEWVSAKDLFDGQLRSPAENLAKGQRLLSECLALDPSSHASRIYLGLVHYVRGQRALSRKQFSQVLAGTEDPLVRGCALLNLGNIHLDEGDCEGAIDLLLRLVDSGVVSEQPSLGTAYFNLGLAYGMRGQFEDCVRWFRRMLAELPHKRSWMGRELGRRSQFVHWIRSHKEARVVSEAFPMWFGVPAPVAGSCGAAESAR